MSRWAETLGTTAAPVILAGLAGALDPAIDAGSAHVIQAVVDGRGNPLGSPSPFAAQLAAASSCRITSARFTLATPAAKRDWFHRTAANLVDLESIAFTRAATRFNWTWAIVRGVSDDAHTTLPANIDQWVDARGSARGWVIAGAIFAQPSLVTSLWRMGRSSRRAMDQVSEKIRELIGIHDRRFTQPC